MIPGQIQSLIFLSEQEAAREKVEMKLDDMIDVLSAVAEPDIAERDCSQMTQHEIEETVLNLVLGLHKLDCLIEVLQRCQFEPGDKEKAEKLVRVATNRIGWACELIMCLKPAC